MSVAQSLKSALRLRCPLPIWLAIAATLTLGSFGCADNKPSARPPGVKPHVQGGYTPAHRSQTIATQDTWLIGSEPVDIRLLVPIQGDNHPLVFYFPGLGESPDAGLAWREFWAEAGYAVLSAQPAKYGVAVWSSDRAHVGDFLDIAKDAFGAPSLETRSQLARSLLDETWRRHRSNAALARLDTSRVAVAGFDLGAQTAMMFAGENVQGVESLQVPEAVKCVIALSPYADFSGMGLESNFKSIRLPVLSVTSSQDTDAYGLVKSAAVRRAPYQYMPPAQKFLLILSGAPHSLFAGASAPAKSSGNYAAQPQSGPESEAEAEVAPSNDDSSARGHGRQNRRPIPDPGISSARRANEVVQVQSVTTAFLDAIVKSDPIASEWMSRNAKPWLGNSAELESK